MQSRRIVVANQYSLDAINYSSGDGRTKFDKQSYACTALIVLLFRFEYIGGLIAFSNGRISLLHYFVTSSFLILPLMYMFLFIGHYSKLGCLVISRIVPITHGVGYTMLVLSVIQAVNEMAVACDSLVYFHSSFSSSIPWMHCNAEWGSDCIGLDEMDECEESKINNESKLSFNFTNIKQLSAFKYRAVELEELQPSSAETVDHFWKQVEGTKLIYLLVITLIVLLLSDLGFSEEGRTTNLLYVFYLFVLCIFTVSAILSSKSVPNIMASNLASLVDSASWFESALYFLKTIDLSVVSTTLIGSYMPFEAIADLQAFIVWIGIMTLYTIGEIMGSFLRSALASKLCTDPSNIKLSDMNGFLVVYPQFFGSLSISPQSFCCCYFFLALVSSLFRIKLLLAATYHTLADGKPIIRLYRFYIRIFSCFILFFLSAPVCIVGIFDNFLLLLKTLEECLNVIVLTIITVCILYVYGTQTLCDDHHFTYGSQPAIFFKMTLLMAPALLMGVGALLFLQISTSYNKQLNGAQLIYIFLPLCMVFQLVGLLYIMIYYLKRQNMAHLLRCEDLWGDPNPTARKERIIYHPRKETNYFRRIEACKHECLRYNKVNAVIVKDELKEQIIGYRLLKKDQKIFDDISFY